jgi:hypothetical protein
MATKNSYWLKLSVGLLDDPIYLDLAKETQLLFIKLYLLAKKEERGGAIGFDGKVLTVKQIAYQLHESEDDLIKALTELVKTDYMHSDESTYFITHYEEEQKTEKQKHDEELNRLRVEKCRSKDTKEDNKEEKNKIEKNKIEKNKIEKNKIEKNRIESNGSVMHYDTITEPLQFYSFDSIKKELEEAFSYKIPDNERWSSLIYFIKDKTELGYPLQYLIERLQEWKGFSIASLSENTLKKTYSELRNPKEEAEHFYDNCVKAPKQE